MAEPKIVVIASVEDRQEDDGRPYKLIVDGESNEHKIKRGQNDFLKNKWHLLEEGKAVKLMYDAFKGYPFVRDFELVKDVFVAEAAKKTHDKSAESKSRSVALSYVKDIVAALIQAGAIREIDEGMYNRMTERAEIWAKWIDGGQADETETPQA